jgi:L-2-hydroxyglutarate oxidase
VIYDYVVVGGGIVGLAVALELRRCRPGTSLLVLEKEAAVAVHQTGRNSGVIHEGVYYSPGSLKARLCKLGAAATKAFCRENGIKYEQRGKLIVATDDIELMRMRELAERAIANDIEFDNLSERELSRLEPAITGRGALLIRGTSIVDYREICLKMMARLSDHGKTEIRFGTRVEAIEESATGVRVSTQAGEFGANRLIACAGLQGDRLARQAGAKTDFRIVPFRGDYYSLAGAPVVRRLVYPVPDPSLPFLGIHMTPMIDGTVTVGPNAVVAFAREKYGKFGVNLRDTASMVTYRGFRKLVRTHWRSGLEEFSDSWSRHSYLRKCQKYCPALTLEHLQPHRSGIRAQAVLPDGTLVHDFLFAQTERTLHVCNAPSPAATSALPIGAMIVERLLLGEASWLE